VKKVYKALMLGIQLYTKEHINKLILDKKCLDFFSEFDGMINQSYSFSPELIKINRILLTFNSDEINNLYKLVKKISKQKEILNIINYQLPTFSNLAQIEQNKKDNIQIVMMEKIKKSSISTEKQMLNEQPKISTAKEVQDTSTNVLNGNYYIMNYGIFSISFQINFFEIYKIFWHLLLKLDFISKQF
jgi:hypothetical protein